MINIVQHQTWRGLNVGYGNTDLDTDLVTVGWLAGSKNTFTINATGHWRIIPSTGNYSKVYPNRGKAGLTTITVLATTNNETGIDRSTDTFNIKIGLSKSTKLTVTQLCEKGTIDVEGVEVDLGMYNFVGTSNTIRPITFALNTKIYTTTQLGTGTSENIVWGTILDSNVETLSNTKSSNYNIRGLPLGPSEDGDSLILSVDALPDTVKELGTNCFADFRLLEKVTMPKSITNVASGSFLRDYNLNVIYAYPTNLPSSTASIAGYNTTGGTIYYKGSDYVLFINNFSKGAENKGLWKGEKF